jgi:hypothetical protein
MEALLLCCSSIVWFRFSLFQFFYGIACFEGYIYIPGLELCDCFYFFKTVCECNPFSPFLVTILEVHFRFRFFVFSHFFVQVINLRQVEPLAILVSLQSQTADRLPVHWVYGICHKTGGRTGRTVHTRHTKHIEEADAKLDFYNLTWIPATIT